MWRVYREGGCSESCMAVLPDHARGTREDPAGSHVIERSFKPLFRPTPQVQACREMIARWACTAKHTTKAAATAAATTTAHLSVELGESLGLYGGDDGLLESLSVLVRGDGGRTLVHVLRVGVVPIYDTHMIYNPATNRRKRP